jgi:hypothetical protein
VNYAKLLEMTSFFTLHIFLEVGKTQDLPGKIWQTLEDALELIIPLFFLVVWSPDRSINKLPGQTYASRHAYLYKSCLSHPDSDLDVPHTNLDLLAKTYPMVKSKLYFVNFDHTGLTGGTHRSDRSDWWNPQV